MTFWDWFKQNGDRAFTFVALASTLLGASAGMPAWLAQLALVSGVLATAAHQSFFPTPSGK